MSNWSWPVEGKPLLRGTMKDPKPLHHPRAKHDGGRDWFVDVTITLKCQVCGFIDKQWTYIYAQSEDVSNSPIFDVPKVYRCSTCTGAIKWGKKGFGTRIRAGWEDYLNAKR